MTHLHTTFVTVAALVAAMGIAHAQPGAPTAPAAAPMAPAAAPRSLVIHVAPLSTPVDQPVELEAMIDAPFAEALTARWRAIGKADWQDVTFERSSAGGWFASLPAARPPGLEYYIRGKDTNGTEVMHFASAEQPHVVRVDPTLYDRLEEIDRERLAGHQNEIALDASGHNFGNRYDIPDYYYRSELTYTHRLLRQLHHIAFGFGAIQGRTPASNDTTMEDDYVNHGQRYGFGEIRVRVHPSVFLDFRVALGVSHRGFDQGVRSQVTFGKPWRSSVSIGGEAMGDMGPTGWVRLQWDTA
ncbi:MAG: hypothetical protein H0T42_00150, partial [Deltaproteobacteria bacterium]|nr:hypothetical protein [Deltaproteobacteria bacterium]